MRKTPPTYVYPVEHGRIIGRPRQTRWTDLVLPVAAFLVVTLIWLVVIVGLAL